MTNKVEDRIKELKARAFDIVYQMEILQVEKNKVLNELAEESKKLQQDKQNED